MRGTYTQRFNARHRLRGHLFAGRYKSLLIDEADTSYLRTVCDYVHLNPVRARLLPEEAGLSSFPWSSYPGYLNPARQRPAWLRVDRLLGEHGIRRDDARGRREFSRRMEQERIDPQDEAVHAGIRRGWQLGGEGFLDRLRDRTTPAVPGSHQSHFVRESMTVKAQRIVGKALSGAGVDLGALATMPKGAELKLGLARKLRQQTTLTLKEIAVLLQAGSWRSLANYLSRPDVI